jgi:Ca2+/Na+ antiporter
MSIGTGVGLVVAGAVLTWAIELDVPYLYEGALGLIAIVAGLAIIAASFVVTARSHNTVAAGLALTAGGAALTWAIDIDLPFVYDGSLGVILMFAGLITVIAAAVMEYQRTRSRHDVEYRYSDGSVHRSGHAVGYRHSDGSPHRSSHHPLTDR